MRKVFCIVALAMLLNNGYVINASEMQENSIICENDADEFWYVIEPTKSTRDYARGFTYNQSIYYGNTLVCVYTVNLSYSYNDEKAVISTFSYSHGSVASGFSVSAYKSVVNGNPAVAKMTVTAKYTATGEKSTVEASYICKTSGNVDINLIQK